MIIGHSKKQDITFLSFHDASLIHIVTILRGYSYITGNANLSKKSLICSVKSPSGRLKSIALHFTVWTFGFLRKNPVAQFWPMGRSSPELAAMCWANSELAQCRSEAKGALGHDPAGEVFFLSRTEALAMRLCPIFWSYALETVPEG